MLMDDNLKYITGSFDPVGSANTVKSHTFSNIPVSMSGYLYVYYSNESPVNVFFDNLQVIHSKGPLLEETHYYPFGLTMAGISSQTLKSDYTENKNKYNGIEQTLDLNLNQYDAFFRTLDPQIGRWWQIDPEVEGYENLSPYNSMYDDPVRYSDPLGNEAEVEEACCGFLGKAVASAAGTLNGMLNGATGGLCPTAPLGTSMYTDEELEYYNKGVQLGQFSALPTTIMVQPLLAPRLVPVIGDQIPFPKTSPLTPPVNNTVNSSSSSSSSTSPASTPPNGSSKNSSKLQHGYEIRERKSNELHKNGVSGQKLNKDGTSPRANSQVNKLNRQAGYDKYNARVLKKNVTGRSGQTIEG
jgi:RHS repeat-associated protein